MPGRHSRSSVHNRTCPNRDNLQPLAHPLLTPREVQTKRVELAAEMLVLILRDGEDLSPWAQQA
jgi:hypothetical protein